MKIAALALLALLLAAPCALADTATIDQSDQGVSISISGSGKKKAANPAQTEQPREPAAPAKASTNKDDDFFPPGMWKLLSPQEQSRAKTMYTVMKDYASKNHYSTFTETQCKQMSEAIWYRLTKRGIPARIAGGNVSTQCVLGGFANYLALADHAWVMAALSPGRWLALETTNGTAVSKQANPLYYNSAIYFDRPENVYRFDGLRRTFVQTNRKISVLKDKWNADAKGKRFNKASELYKDLQRRAKKIDAMKTENHNRLLTLEKIYNDGIYLH